ncbi:hypothetical protein QCA50_004063 [Cerrena zonata]|uniref:SnoaL-like domain-containing protein n=1 Tax=Cerrena zonata TaxID=2478898 RepID=A0AAW0GG77_9APHY
MSASVIGAIPSKPSPQLQTVIDYLSVLCQGDFDKMSGLLTDDFTHYFHPKSLGYPPADKTAWIGFNKGGFHMFKEFKFNVHGVVEGHSNLTIHDPWLFPRRLYPKILIFGPIRPLYFGV